MTVHAVLSQIKTAVVDGNETDGNGFATAAVVKGLKAWSEIH